MSKIKVSDLKDEKLAEWVARSQGWEYGVVDYCGTEWETEWQRQNNEFIDEIGITDIGEYFIDRDSGTFILVKDYRPDINGGQAMELAEKYRIDITVYEHHVNASVTFPECKFGVFGKGKSHREAICRAVIASVYGEYVEDSD